MADYDILGNIAIIKSEHLGKNKTKGEKLKQARELLKNNSIRTVLEKAGDIKGRLRTIKPRLVLGEKNFIADYKENNCRFKFDVRTCYFSPRISGERKMISDKINGKDTILVMFAGVGVYPIVIYKYKKPKKIVGVELGKDCCKYALENIRLNKIPKDKIEVIQGDVKKKIRKGFGKFSVVIMARPNLKDSFLEQGLNASRKGTRLFYYGFCNVKDKTKMIEGLIDEAGKMKRKIKLIGVEKAGDIAPYKYRYRIEFKLLN